MRPKLLAALEDGNLVGLSAMLARHLYLIQV